MVPASLSGRRRVDQGAFMRRVVAYARVIPSGLQIVAALAVRRLLLCGLLLALIACGTGLSGCAVKLAPDYDKTILEGLDRANQDAMRLFASASSGSFSTREGAYVSVLGELDAVQVQVASRGTPTPPALLTKLVTTIGDDEAKELVNQALIPPTAGSIASLRNIVVNAQQTDRGGKLSRARMEFFKEAFAIQMAQALAYEKALQR
jgi:hypothetical protein